MLKTFVHPHEVYRLQFPAHWEKWQKITRDFTDGIIQSVEAPLGEEAWDEVQNQIVPVLKPMDYIEGSSAHAITPRAFLVTRDGIAVPAEEAD